MSEIVVRRYAGPYERYGVNAFAGSVGRVMKLNTALGVVAKGARLVEAEVALDGSYVDLVIEIPTNVATLLSSGFLG